MNADRTKFLGGSDIAAVLGLSQWATPLDVWREKLGMGREIDPDKERIFRRGKRLEPLIIDMLIEEFGVEVTSRSADIEGQNRYQDGTYDFLSAEIDFEWRVTPEMVARFPQIDPRLIGTIQNGDAKSCHPFVAWKFGADGTDEIPIEYHAQAQHGLGITGRELTLFAVLVGTDNLLTYIVLRDEDTIAGMREKAVAFWTDNVLGAVPPDPITLEDVYRLLRRDANTVIEADEETARNIAHLKIARDEAKAAKANADDLCFQIGRAVLGAEAMSFPSKKPKQVIVVNGQPALSISFQHQDRIDSDMVRARHPAVAAECAQPVEFFRFDLPKGRKA